jgi:Leucine-rich repeat (LRR) protein
MRLTLNQLLLATKNYLLVVLPFFCLLTAVHAQNIPDANFAAAIRAVCPLCITASPSNNLTATAATTTSLDVSNKTISNLTGINGFTNLRTLNCSQNQLTSLPALPTTLTNLNCGINQLASLPTLPAGLQILTCYVNALTSLPTLPNVLDQLYAQANRLTTLPAFPNSLRFADFSSNLIINVSSITGSSLRNLYLNQNSITMLPALPNSLQYLYVSQNQLASLPNLPNLIVLYCDNNRFTSLPNLPSTLQVLRCYNNQLTSLPSLPSTLTTLECFNNQIRSLPTLPLSLTALRLDPTRTTCLPNAVAGLNVYNPSNTLITASFPVCSGSACSPTIVVSPVIVSTVTQTSCIGVPLGLSASASAVGTATMTVKWQRKKPSDADFTDVTAAVAYLSGTVVFYTVPAISPEDNMTQYRAVFSGTCANSVAIGSAPAAIATREGLNIPDIYLRNAIRRSCPTCINNCGNLTADAANTTQLNIENLTAFQSIKNLSGIEGFANLEELNIGSNTITNFPKLPEQLKKLTISNNNLSSLPELPNSLEVLICKNNNLSYLPLLPSSLMHLDCSSNKLTELPADLPASLMALDCSNNELIGLPPSLPVGLKTIYCHKNKLVTLPTLPTALNYFNCGNNMLSDLPPSLPTGLWTLVCSSNPTLKCLPILPASLHELYISPENVSCLRNMPPSLRVFDAMNEPIDRPLCSPTQCLPFRPTDEEPEAMKAKTRVANQLKAFPNPVDKQLQVEFTATEEGQTNISVTDVLGRQMSIQMVDTFKGVNQATVDMSNVPRGVYVLILRTGKTQVVQRITKN